MIGYTRVKTMATSDFSLINVGTNANSRDGDPLRVAFQKINQNFSEIDGLIQQYFDDFLSQPNQLPTDIVPITPNTNVTISSTGTGIIILTAPTVQISNNLTVGGTLTVNDKFTAFGDAEFRGDVDISNGNLRLDGVSLLGAKIDCGRF